MSRPDLVKLLKEDDSIFLKLHSRGCRHSRILTVTIKRTQPVTKIFTLFDFSQSLAGLTTIFALKS
jgi:hypothetical protein